MSVKPVLRGCGTREKGGMYWECGLIAGGAFLEDYLLDPPVRLPDGVDLQPRGVMTYERDGVTHLFDWVGEKYYPNVTDFIEEVRRYGVSRRIPPDVLSMLTAESRLLTVHRKVLVKNAELWRSFQKKPTYYCPKQNQQHEIGADDCLGICWELVNVAEPTMDKPVCYGEYGRMVKMMSPWLVKRKMPAFQYYAGRKGVIVEPEWEPAIFASWPLRRIVIVKNPGGTMPDVRGARIIPTYVDE